MLNTPFSDWPCYTEEEAHAVRSVLLSNKVNYWTGNETKCFEQEFATFAGTDFAVAVSNGTVALDLALKALKIGPGDEVVVTPRTFIASVSSIVNAGAIPVFADIDPDSQNITADTVAKVITQRTRAIICVHLAGWPCDLDPIMDLAKIRNLYVIEDCAQAHGAVYKGKAVGSIGDIGCWSFCQDKIITTGGEGGMVTTNNKSLWLEMWSFKDHGKNWNSVHTNDQPAGFKWLHDSFGTNWRMTEMQAVLGRIQLTRLPEWQVKRWNNLSRIWAAAKECKSLRVPDFCCGSLRNTCNASKSCKHAAYKCYVFTKGDAQKRDQIIKRINERGVPSFPGSCSEVYLEKAFQTRGLRPKARLEQAKRLGETSIMFLCHPTLTEQEIELTCRVIKETCK